MSHGHIHDEDCDHEHDDDHSHDHHDDEEHHHHAAEEPPPPADFTMPETLADKKQWLEENLHHKSIKSPHLIWLAVFKKEQEAEYARIFHAGSDSHLHFNHMSYSGKPPLHESDEQAITALLESYQQYVADQQAGLVSTISYEDGRLASLLEGISPHLKPLGAHYDDFMRIIEYALTGNSSLLYRMQGMDEAEIHTLEAKYGIHVHGGKPIPEVAGVLGAVLAAAMLSDKLGDDVPRPVRVLLEAAGAWPIFNALVFRQLEHGWEHAKHGEHMEDLIKPLLGATLMLAGIFKKDGSHQLYAGSLMLGIIALVDSTVIDVGEQTMKATRALETEIEQLPKEAVLEGGSIIDVGALQPGEHSIRLKPGDTVPVNGRIQSVGADGHDTELEVSHAGFRFGEDSRYLVIGELVPQGAVVEQETLLAVDATYEQSARVKEWHEREKKRSESQHKEKKPSRAQQIGQYATYGTVIGTALVGMYHFLSPLWKGLGLDPAQALDRMTSFATVSSPCQILISPFIETAFANKMAGHGVGTLDQSKQQVVHQVTDYCVDWSGTCDYNALFDSMSLYDSNGQELPSGTAQKDALKHATLLALATDSDHEMQQAIRRHYLETHGVEALGELRKQASEAVVHPEDTISKGVSGNIDGKSLRVGRLSYVAGDDDVPEFIREIAEAEAQQGNHKTTFYRRTDTAGEDQWGMMRFTNELRPQIVEALKSLNDAGRVHITTGIANEELIAQYTDAAGISRERIHTNMLKQDKAELVKALQADGGTVAFVGDGGNDREAFEVADVRYGLQDTMVNANYEHTDFLIDHPGLIAEHRKAAEKVSFISLATTIFATAYTALLSLTEALGLTKLPIIGAVLGHEVVTGAIPIAQNIALDRFLLTGSEQAAQHYAPQLQQVA